MDSKRFEKRKKKEKKGHLPAPVKAIGKYVKWELADQSLR